MSGHGGGGPYRLVGPDKTSTTISKISILESTLDLIDTQNLRPETVGGVYQALGEIAWMIEGCEADALVVAQAGGSLTREIVDLYSRYTTKLNDLVEAVSLASFVEASERYLLEQGGQSRRGGRRVVWMLDGIYPQHRLGRVVALYLSGSQIKSGAVQHVVERSLVDPSFLRADLVVETPASVLEVLTRWNLTRGSGVELNSAELDYLCGLWSGRGGRAGFEAAVRRAQKLARHSKTRS